LTELQGLASHGEGEFIVLVHAGVTITIVAITMSSLLLYSLTLSPFFFMLEPVGV
jgi:hypothetical protein